MNSKTASPVAKAELNIDPLPTHTGNTDHIAGLTEVLHWALSSPPAWREQRVTVSATVLMQSTGPVAVSNPEAETEFGPRSTTSSIV